MKILIVDDETINRALLANMLHNAGYTDCVVAESGEEALRLFEQETPDLVLLDVVMPGMSGFDVAPLIRSKADGSYLPSCSSLRLKTKKVWCVVSKWAATISLLSHLIGIFWSLKFVLI